MEYEVYRHVDAADEDFEHIDSFFKRVLAEDKHLCNAAQRNLNAGVFINGELHPHLESAPLYFQNVVRRLVTDHRKSEEAKGEEIWPARRSLPVSKITEDDEAFCAGLACDSVKSAETEW
jgi:hypothetical protein